MTLVTSLTLNDLVGVPYLDRGRSLGGADCWGIACLYHQHMLGSKLPDYLSLYDSADDSGQAALAFALGRRAWHAVTPEQVKDGDVALLRVMGYPCHCGVLLGDGFKFLHTLRGRHSTIETLEDISWRNRIEGVWRWVS